MKGLQAPSLFHINSKTRSKENLMAELNNEFIRKAMKVTSFNLAVKDFESLKYKKEIQHIFGVNFFPKFDMKMVMKRVDKTQINRVISQLRKENPNNFQNLFKYNLKGVGPGEVMMYFLLEDAYLGGGTSAGVDLVIGSDKYEIKAVNYSPKGYVTNFKVGGTFSLAGIIKRTIDLKVKLGLGAGSEVNLANLEQLKAQYPGEMKEIFDEYADVTYRNYFRNHDIIFVSNKRAGGFQLGDIIDVKRIQKEQIQFERITSGTIKPRVTIK